MDKLDMRTLWNRYSNHNDIEEWMTEDNFTKAIAEIISLPVEAGVKPANGGREEFDKFEAELYSNFLDEFEEEFKKVKALTPNNIFNWLANKTWRKSRLSV
jgi:hypothetical protein